MQSTKIILFVFLLTTTLFSAVPNFRGGEYEKLSTETITLGWDINATEVIDYWEVKALWIDVNPIQEYLLGATPNNKMTVRYIRSGHFVYGVRACQTVGPICSDWSFSNDITNTPQVENAQGVFEPCIWRVSWKLAPPIIIIEDAELKAVLKEIELAEKK